MAIGIERGFLFRLYTLHLATSTTPTMSKFSEWMLERVALRKAALVTEVILMMIQMVRYLPVGLSAGNLLATVVGANAWRDDPDWTAMETCHQQPCVASGLSEIPRHPPRTRCADAAFRLHGDTPVTPILLHLLAAYCWLLWWHGRVVSFERRYREWWVESWHFRGLLMTLTTLLPQNSINHGRHHLPDEACVWRDRAGEHPRPSTDANTFASSDASNGGEGGGEGGGQGGQPTITGKMSPYRPLCWEATCQGRGRGYLARSF